MSDCGFVHQGTLGHLFVEYAFVILHINVFDVESDVIAFSSEY